MFSPLALVSGGRPQSANLPPPQLGAPFNLIVVTAPFPSGRQRSSWARAFYPEICWFFLCLGTAVFAVVPRTGLQVVRKVLLAARGACPRSYSRAAGAVVFGFRGKSLPWPKMILDVLSPKVFTKAQPRSPDPVRAPRDSPGAEHL